MSTPVDDPPAGGLAGPPPSTWEFDVLAAAEGGGCGLREVAWEIFESTGVTARFGVPDERFQAFLGRMELLYSVQKCKMIDERYKVLEKTVAPTEKAVSMAKAGYHSLKEQ